MLWEAVVVGGGRWWCPGTAQLRICGLHTVENRWGKGGTLLRASRSNCGPSNKTFSDDEVQLLALHEVRGCDHAPLSTRSMSQARMAGCHAFFASTISHTQ